MLNLMYKHFMAITLMNEAFKVIILIIEAIHSAIDWRRQNEFEKNITSINDDPVAYAKRKFGMSKSADKDKLQDSEADADGK